MQTKRAVPIVVVTLLGWCWFAWPVVTLPLVTHAVLGAEQSNSPQTVVSIDEVIRAKKDLWGDAAERQEDGPSYEFFEKLLPPIRYVNASFRHYPLVLCAPRTATKARFVGNGSGVNLSAHGAVGWRDVGFPVTFRVGDREELYGRDLARLDGPRLARGYLPIVELCYREYGSSYAQEAFVSVEPSLADHAAVFVRFAP